MGIIKHSKRFLLRFYTWWYEYPDSGINQFSKRLSHDHVSDEEFDTIEELKEAMRLYDDIYKNTPSPIFIDSELVHRKTGVPATKKIRTDVEIRGGNSDYYQDYVMSGSHYDFLSGTARFWGYVTLDFEEEKILGVYHDKKDLWVNWKTDLKLMDRLFRKPDEVPEGYEWDDGEYAGWLQFRWGNGLNAIEIEDRLNEAKKTKSAVDNTGAFPVASDSSLENQLDLDIEKELRNIKGSRW